MDERHLFAAARYILLNPVRAGLVRAPGDWPHSSVRAHLEGRSDGVVDIEGLAARIPDWTTFLLEAPTWNERTRLRRHECSGIPLGDDAFLREIEALSGRQLRPHCGWGRLSRSAAS